MANPNIVNLTSVVGFTTVSVNISNTTPTVIISNASSSNKLVRINSLMASNKLGTSAAVSVIYYTAAGGPTGSGTSVSIATTSSIPSGATLVIIGRNAPVYLEENTSICALSNSLNAIDVVSSYDLISG